MLFVMFYQTGETPLHYASRAGNVAVLGELLSRLRGNDVIRAVNQQSARGWSPLLAAAQEGHVEVKTISHNIKVLSSSPKYFLR